MNIWELALLLFVFIPMAILWFRTIMDIFDRRDLPTLSKGLWLLAVIAVPLIGVLVYLFTRPVTDQDREHLETYRRATHQRQAAAGFSIADEVEKLDGLLTKGVITQDEFNRQRTSLLA